MFNAVSLHHHVRERTTYSLCMRESYHIYSYNSYNKRDPFILSIHDKDFFCIMTLFSENSCGYSVQLFSHNHHHLLFALFAVDCRYKPSAIGTFY